MIEPHWDLVAELADQRREAGHPVCRYCRGGPRRKLCVMCDHTGYSEWLDDEDEPEEDPE